MNHIKAEIVEVSDEVSLAILDFYYGDGRYYYYYYYAREDNESD